jgi:CRAL/TRIO domain
MENLLSQHQQSGPTAVELALDDYEMTMKLNPLEMHRALVIKEAVEAATHLTNMTDFEYVQWALIHPVTHGAGMAVPLSTILEHISRMQEFSRSHRIQETADEGAQMVHELSLELPGLYLSLQYLPSSGNCIAVSDFKALLPGKIKTDQQWHIFVKGSYYRYHAMSPHFHAMREGMANLCECEGVSFQNYDDYFWQQLLEELHLSYPKRHKETFFVHSPMAMNIIYGLCKPYMTQNLKETFHLGYQIQGLEGHRIDELFKVPDEETARQNMVDQVHRLLVTRYRNQARFRIPSHITSDDLWRQLIITPQLQQPQEQEQQQQG